MVFETDFSYSTKFAKRMAFPEMNPVATDAKRVTSEAIDAAGEATYVAGEASCANGEAKRLFTMISHPHSNRCARRLVFPKQNSLAFGANSSDGETIRATGEAMDVASEANKIAGKAFQATDQDKKMVFTTNYSYSNKLAKRLVF